MNHPLGTPSEAPALSAVQQPFLPLMARAPDAVIILNAIGQIILVKPQTECWL